jgi:salicylate hydroxylase
MPSRTIGIIGGGIGGLAAAIGLHRVGKDVVVFEQARQFTRVGSDVNLTPNAAHAADGLGLGDALRETAARPARRLSRNWDTGEVTSSLEMQQAAIERYGAPQLTMHRADLLRAFENALPEDRVRLGKRLVSVTEEGDEIVLGFADGTSEPVHALIGADGIHSVVRTHLLGEDKPNFTGVVAFRTVVPIERLSTPNLDCFTKWWGPSWESMIVTFPISRGREIFIFATVGQDDWRHESWTMPGTVEELRGFYKDFHPDARALLDACDSVLKTALYDRAPLPFWSRGRITLVGDACHPMMPFMAQGAAMSIEDAVLLTRHIEAAGEDELPAALKAYETSRFDRTSRVQAGSRRNDWLREGTNGDWLYGYDSWGVALG